MAPRTDSLLFSADFGMSRTVDTATVLKEDDGTSVEKDSVNGNLRLSESWSEDLLTAQRGTPRWMAVLDSIIEQDNDESLLVIHQLFTIYDELVVESVVLQPELCQHEVMIREKFKTATEDSDSGRDRREAMASARRFQDDRWTVGDGMKMDCYAFGCCLFEIVSHEPPFASIQAAADVYIQVMLIASIASVAFAHSFLSFFFSGGSRASTSAHSGAPSDCS